MGVFGVAPILNNLALRVFQPPIIVADRDAVIGIDDGLFRGGRYDGDRGGEDGSDGGQIHGGSGQVAWRERRRTDIVLYVPAPCQGRARANGASSEPEASATIFLNVADASGSEGADESPCAGRRCIVSAVFNSGTPAARHATGATRASWASIMNWESAVA